LAGVCDELVAEGETGMDENDLLEAVVQMVNCTSQSQ
jgi:hypothetical protein